MTSPRLVVGAIIVDSLEAPTKVLAARRTSPPELAGMWEFPGGKVEDGETPEAGLVREIREELSARIVVGAELSPPDGGTWPISDRYAMRLYFAGVVEGKPRLGQAHDDLRWVEAELLASMDWLPSDRAALGKISESLLTI
ncbi:(deoxy)nucleoside triphosphate pyrophosphohydrolase [Aeromicrobium sp. CF3.5]|uniref:(deoxy)nucleoside triphosphate pyrophosphohydrolase n=1 Tax=Aeromicrobium sp. CF3.5 TaxID=3373078 RepID=UPI003EE48317